MDKSETPRCVFGHVTRGCDCVACSDLREARMTYKQRRRLSMRRHAERFAAALKVRDDDDKEI